MSVLGKLVPDCIQDLYSPSIFFLIPHITDELFSTASNNNTIIMTIIIKDGQCISVIFIFNMLSNAVFA